MTKRQHRLALLGFHHEANTFAPQRADRGAFQILRQTEPRANTPAAPQRLEAFLRQAMKAALMSCRLCLPMPRPWVRLRQRRTTSSRPSYSPLFSDMARGTAY